MPMPVAPVIQCPADQNETGADADRAQIDREAGQEEYTCHDSNRESVSKCNGKRREPYEAPVVAMKSQCDGEQPAHRRIEPMKRAKAGEGEPRPELGLGGAHGSLSRPPASAGRFFRMCVARALAVSGWE